MIRWSSLLKRTMQIYKVPKRLLVLAPALNLLSNNFPTTSVPCSILAFVLLKEQWSRLILLHGLLCNLSRELISYISWKSSNQQPLAADEPRVVTPLTVYQHYTKLWLEVSSPFPVTILHHLYLQLRNKTTWIFFFLLYALIFHRKRMKYLVRQEKNAQLKSRQLEALSKFFEVRKIWQVDVDCCLILICC